MRTSQPRESFPGRTFYQGAGVCWNRFLPWLLAAFAVAAVLAAGMFQLFCLGHYYVFIVPVIAALAVGGMIRLAVGKGHCRSAGTGAAAGATAGLLLYLGYYYCGMVYHLGSEMAGRPDLLPAYIQLRMQTDVIRDVNRPDRDESAPRRRGSAWFNWFTFAFEFAVVLGVTGVAGFKRSRKAYCETCRRWMVREVTHFDPALSGSLIEALRSGSARSLAALCAKPAFATVPNTTLAADLCPSVKDGLTRDCPVYVSIKAVVEATRGPGMDPFESAKGELLVRSLQLNPDEIAALGSRFQVFETVAGRAAVAALRPEETLAEKADAAGACAEISAVEPEYAGKVMTRRTALIGNALTLSALVVLFAGIALAAWGGITAFPDKQSGPGVPVSPERKALGIAALSLGLVWFGGVALFFFVNPSYFGNRYLRQRLRSEFSRRPKCLVDPNDPEALFVEIVPKLNWGKMMLETASDAGFLRVDPRRREILFEGDRQRYRIPADTITHCAVEVHVEGQGTAAATRIFFVVIRARHPDGFWEAPIRERTGTGKFRAGRRKEATLRLCETIQQIRGVGRGTS